MIGRVMTGNGFPTEHSPLTPYPHPIIAREGWSFLIFAISAAAAVHWFAGWTWAIPLWIIAVFVLQFFRDPARQVPDIAGCVTSPADGRIVAVERVEDPYLKRDTIKVSVFMNVFNVHSNRSPVIGQVQQVWYNAGKFVNAALAKASTENERNAVWLKTPEGWDITAVQVAGLIARRIICYVKPQESLQRGQRYGFIRFGSRVDVYLPPVARVRVAVGDKVSAGSTILAELPDKVG